MTTSDALQPGTLLGPFEIEEPLGHGSFGAVYGARVRVNGVRVALKVLHPHLAHNKQAYARFLREAQLAAKIKHPHVVDILSVGQEGRYLFYCMEYLEGEALAALLKRMEVLSVAETVRLLIPVFAGVAAIHAAGFVHRDLKPANLFLWKPTSGTIHPKILDFGVIKQVDLMALNEEPLTNSQMALGTPHYMAPEQIKDSKNVTSACDQWSLGVILYECLTKTRPFQGNAVYEVFTKVLHTPPVAPRKLVSTIPESLEAIILRMLEREPSKRFPSVQAVGLALLEFADAGTRRRYGREFGVRDSMEEVTEVDGQPSEDYTGTSILAPERSTEFLVPLEQIRGMLPSTRPAEFVRADLKAERRRALPVWALWGVLMLFVTCGFGMKTSASIPEAPRAHREDAAVEERPLALVREGPVRQVLSPSPTPPPSVAAPTPPPAAVVVTLDAGTLFATDANTPSERHHPTARDASIIRRRDARPPTDRNRTDGIFWTIP